MCVSGLSCDYAKDGTLMLVFAAAKDATDVDQHPHQFILACSSVLSLHPLINHVR